MKKEEKLEKRLKILKLKLNLDSPELTEKQERMYNLLSNNKEGILKKPKDKRSYLISELKHELKLDKFYATLRYCREHGHKEKKGHASISSSSHMGTRVYATCSRCGQMYERGLTTEEWERFDKAMRTPFTI
ncbi:MAG: hypothetical protein ACFFG0_56455 [Candidatus Thorarchaeota archaeon]